MSEFSLLPKAYTLAFLVNELVFTPTCSFLLVNSVEYLSISNYPVRFARTLV